MTEAHRYSLSLLWSGTRWLEWKFLSPNSKISLLTIALGKWPLKVLVNEANNNLQTFF